MISYRVANLRRLKLMPLIELRPLTILVGRNSSGKSTFLRSLPLISQSISTPTNGVILWWGDYVDFGSFEEAKFRSESVNSVVFEFGVEPINFIDGSLWYDGHYTEDTPSARLERNKAKITLKLVIGQKEKQLSEGEPVFVSEFVLSELKTSSIVSFSIGENGEVLAIKFNGEDCRDFVFATKPTIRKNYLFPSINFPYDFSGDDQIFNPHSTCEKYIVDEVSRKIKPYCHGRTKDETIAGYARLLLSIGFYSKAAIEQEFGGNTGKLKFYSFINRYLKEANESTHREMRRLFFLYWVESILDNVVDALRSTFSNLHYIGPARARSERYYRQQDLSVSKISADGTNFPMFLASLDVEMLEDFSNILYRLYGYRIEIRKSSGHISIFLVEDSGLRTNLVDTGYGLSQILPVLGQIWWSSVSSDRVPSIRYRGGARILAVEQPELHLHPAHQARLAEAFVQFVGVEGEVRQISQHSISFLVETHSETLINKLGELVFEGKIAPEDIQILVFDDDAEDERATSVQIASFDSAGSLLNWPVGFFGGE